MITPKSALDVFYEYTTNNKLLAGLQRQRRHFTVEINPRSNTFYPEAIIRFPFATGNNTRDPMTTTA